MESTNSRSRSRSADESFMIFASNGRLHGDSADHLYVAFRRAGRWSEPIPLRYRGDDAGGRSTDDEPHFRPDARTMYFSSDRLVKGPSFPRSRAQAQVELERMDDWNNGNLNAWVVPGCLFHTARDGRPCNAPACSDTLSDSTTIAGVLLCVLQRS